MWQEVSETQCDRITRTSLPSQASLLFCLEPMLGNRNPPHTAFAWGHDPLALAWHPGLLVERTLKRPLPTGSWAASGNLHPLPLPSLVKDWFQQPFQALAPFTCAPPEYGALPLCVMTQWGSRGSPYSYCIGDHTPSSPEHSQALGTAHTEKPLVTALATSRPQLAPPRVSAVFSASCQRRSLEKQMLFS